MTMDPHMFDYLPVPKILIFLAVAIAVLAFGAGMVVHLLLKI